MASEVVKKYFNYGSYLEHFDNFLIPDLILSNRNGCVNTIFIKLNTSVFYTLSIDLIFDMGIKM